MARDALALCPALQAREPQGLELGLEELGFSSDPRAASGRYHLSGRSACSRPYFWAAGCREDKEDSASAFGGVEGKAGKDDSPSAVGGVQGR